MAQRKSPAGLPVGASVSPHVDPNYRMQKIPAPPAMAGPVSITIELRISRMG
jgi:hypothetical protein